MVARSFQNHQRAPGAPRAAFFSPRDSNEKVPRRWEWGCAGDHSLTLEKSLEKAVRGFQSVNAPGGGGGSGGETPREQVRGTRCGYGVRAPGGGGLGLASPTPPMFTERK